ncbi:MAG: thioredoxin fold domain-containing protein [Betaproteobacteria bacterium]|nr:thioredoxin fold domain-containing protein [Betaproteobacteria bacterium]MDE2124402.1 thioredoxin fold domain-containing protein [Betaproteobacteria bacterium]MDE2186790.1 thioredoxin fold domain-containing protein [Betaproteobacteria bacterium]MDE2325395.1 thioredoxin fold domain-containing protein [Betaproteobacteria bacterium]
MKRIVILLMLLASLAWVQSPAWAASPSTEQLAAGMLDHMHEATAIPEGRGKRVVNIFFDPNCPYCHKLYNDLRPWVGKDSLQLRWIPVAILTPSSVTKAAAILQAPNRLQAFYKNENNYDFNPSGSPGGGIDPAKVVEAQTRKAIDANDAVLKRAGIYYAIPLVVFRDKAGKAELFIGAPQSDRQLKAMLASVE